MLRQFLAWLLIPWQFFALHVRRTWVWDLGTIQLTSWEQTRLTARGISDSPVCQYLAWRRSTLFTAGMFTLVVAVIQTIFTYQYCVDHSWPWSDLGVVIHAVRISLVCALPVTSFLAFALWSRARLSRGVVLVGVAAAFLVPVLLSLLPPHWLVVLDGLTTAEQRQVLDRLSDLVNLPIGPQISPERVHQNLVRLMDLVGGVLYGLMLLPTLLSVLPGVFRACLRLKIWLPESVFGWSLVTAAPVYALGFTVLLVFLFHAIGHWLVLCSALMFATAPLVYLIRAPLFLQPLTGEEASRKLRRVKLIYRVMIISGAVCFFASLCTLKIDIAGKIWYGFAWNGQRALVTPWELAQFVIEYIGRALFVMIVVADVILRMHAHVWAKSRTFMGSETAAKYDTLMNRLCDAVSHDDL